MKILVARLLVVLLLPFILSSCGGDIGPLPLAFNAWLTGREEVPPAATYAYGSGVVTVDSDRRTLTASVVATGLADLQAGIYQGAPGTVGPLIIPLTREPGNTVWTASVALNDAQLAVLRAGLFYFNVSSAAFPGGEIRGQIIEEFPSSDQVFNLEQVSAQSALVRLQLRQLDDILFADDWRFTGIGLTIGF